MKRRSIARKPQTAAFADIVDDSSFCNVGNWDCNDES